LSILKRIGINDVGGPTQVGGNDWDELYDYLNNVSLAGKSAAINTTTSAASGKLGFSGYADITAISAPASPSSGILRIFADISDGIFKVKKSTGTVVDLEAAGGGGGGDVTGASNVGSGAGQVFRDEVTGVLNLKTLLAGTNVTITNNANDITIAATGGGGGGDVTGASNVGTGTGLLFRDEVAGVLNLKSLLAGSNITIANNANDVTVSATGATPSVQSYTYFIYKDPADSLFKARRGAAGSILTTTSATNVTAVLDAVVADISPPTTPTIIIFGPGDFPMTTVFNNITVPVIGNLTIRGQGMGATNLVPGSGIAGGTVFEIFGSVTGSQTNLTANAAAGDSTIAVTSAAAFAAGDTILLRSSAAFSTASSAQGKKGEIHKIVSIASNTITLDKWTHDAYATADTANIIKLATLDNVTLEDLTLKAGAGYVGTGTFFRFAFCDNLRLNRVHVQNSLGTAFDLVSCINFNADVTLEQTPTATFNSQYGFKPTCASENGFARITGIGRWRHVVTIDASGTANFEGQVRNIEFSGTCETSDEASWDTHATGENISFRNCNVQASRSGTAGTSDAKGFQMRAKKCNIQDCNVWETVGKGITLMEDASGSIVSGCNINRSRQLPGNSTLGHGIEIRAGTNNCVISGNNIEGSHREGILFRSASSGHVITGNIINGSNNEGIDAPDITNVVVSGNRIVNCSKAINMTGTSDIWNIVGNAVSGNTSPSTVTGASNKILGNRGDATLDDGVSATALDGLTDVAITSPARGDILVRDVTQFVNKAKGTANQVLAMDGTGTDPVWTTPASASAGAEPYTYLIYKDPSDSNYKAKNGITGAIDYSSATNCTALLDSIVDNTTPVGNPTIIEFGPGDFNLTTVFDNFLATDIGNLTIRGQGMGVTNLIVTSSITGSSHVLNISGGTTGSQTNLTANALVSSPTLTVASAASLAAGDYVLIRSTKAWSTAGSAQGKQGEIRRIISIATNTLRFDKWIQDTYNTVDTSNVIKVNMLRNITLEGFTIKAGAGYTGTNVFVFCGYIDNLTIRDVETLDYRQAFEGSILIRSCHNVDANCVVHQSPSMTFNNQYGICIGNACEHVKVNVQGKGKFRHTQTVDSTSAAGWEGQVRSLVVSGTSEATDEAHFDSHAAGEDILFIGCSVNSQRTDTSNFDAKAIQIRTKKTSVVGCDFSNCIGECLSIEEDASGCIISGNRISDTRETDTASTGYGLDIRTGVNNVTITGNTFSGNKRQAIRLLTTSSGHVITGNQIINNTGSPGIDATDVTNVVVSGNRITGCSKAINMAGTCDTWNIIGNSVGGNSGTSTVVGASNKILGNKGDTTLDDGVSATTLDGLTDVTITTPATNQTLTYNGSQWVNSAASGGGAAPSQYWRMYIDTADANKIKATNGVTTLFHASDAGDVLSQVFTSIAGITTPFIVDVAPGNYLIKSWDGPDFNHSNFTIRGSGSGVTNFVITDDLENVAGHNSMFNFQGPSADTAINLAADAPQDSWAVMVNSITGLSNGMHVLLGSSAILPLGSAETGEHNRIVKIVATGGSPSHRIILEKSTRYNYNTADTAYIRPKAFLENIRFEGFSLKADQSLATYTKQLAFMRLDYCFNVYANDIEFKDWGNFAGGFHHCFVNNLVIDSVFNNMVFEISPERGHSTGQNAVGYAISCRAGCETVYYTNCRFIGLIRHCFTTTANVEGDKVGQPINIWMVNCNAETADEAMFESHGEGIGMNYINCSSVSSRSGGATDTVEGVEDTDAFSNRCNNVRYINCSVENCRGTPFSFGDGTSGHQLYNCKAKNIHLGRNALQIAADNVDVNGFYAENVDGRGLLIDSGATNVNVSNCVFKNCNNAFPTNSVVKLEGSVKNVNLSMMTIETANNATTSPPIALENTSEDVTISHIICSGGSKRCDLNGMNIKLDHTTCTGGGLGVPLRKEGNFEFVGTSGSTGVWSAQSTAAGGSKRVETTDGLFCEFATNTLNLVQGVKTNNYTERDLDPYLRFSFRLEQTTGVRMFIGWSSNDSQVGPPSQPTNNADPLINQSGFGVFVGVGGNFVIYHNNGGATTTTGATIATIDANKHVIELRANNTSSGFQWRWDHGAWSALITTNIPAATSDICLQAYMENVETGVTKTLNALRSYTYMKNMEFFA
jgi:nitrous oxidase accessory protein NosD